MILLKVILGLLYCAFGVFTYLEEFLKASIGFKISFVTGRLAMGLLLADLFIK